MMTSVAKDFGTIGVLMGGYSSEREISLKSGLAVVESLRKVGCSVVPIDINVRERDRIKDVLMSANLGVGFIALHGALGEDGTIQSILEELRIPYTGSGVAASVCAFNKVATQRILKEHRLPVPEFCVVHKDAVDIDSIVRAIGTFPVVVKPACEGSSIGVTLARQKEDLSVALTEAFRYGKEAIVERFIPGRELTVGIMDREALPIVEIKPQKQFFDFEAKYQKGMTEYIVPAPLAPELAREIQSIGLQAHQAVGCEVYSRVDFRLDPDNRPFILEINTIPGFTETSLFPKAARQAGMEFTDVCLRLIKLAYGKKKD
jgi:D-alanine-D-alanine ligase